MLRAGLGGAGTGGFVGAVLQNLPMSCAHDQTTPFAAIHSARVSTLGTNG